MNFRPILLGLCILLLAGASGCNFGAPINTQTTPPPGGGTEGEGLSGTLVVPSGEPAANAMVRVFPAEASHLARGTATEEAAPDSVATNTAGRFAFDSLSPGTYNLESLVHKGDSVFGILVRAIDFDSAVDLGIDTLRATSRVTIHVRTSGGLPVAGVRCQVAATSFIALSNGSGECQLQLPQNVYRFEISRTGYKTSLSEPVSVPSGSALDRHFKLTDATAPGNPDTTLYTSPPDTTGNPPDTTGNPSDTTGLLAHFAFDEGIGTSTIATGRANLAPAALTGATWGDGVNGSGLLFNGETHHAVVQDARALSGMSQLTVEAWVKPTTSITVPFQRIAAVWGPAGTIDDSWTLTLLPGDYLTLEVVNASRLVDKSAVSSTPLTIGTWNHVAGVFAGGAIQLYLNGSLVYDGPSISGPLQEIDRPLEIGAILSSSGDPVDSWPGEIDELKVYDVPRTDAQIMESYQNTRPDPGGGGTDTTEVPSDTTAPLPDTLTYFGLDESTVALWNFNGYDADNNIQDLGPHGFHLSRDAVIPLESSPNGQAADLNGSLSHRFSVPYDSRLSVMATGTQTFEVRIYMEEYPAASNLEGRGFLIGMYAGMAIKIFNDGRFEVLHQRNDGSQNYWYSAWSQTAAVPLNEWVDIAVAIDHTVTPQQFYGYINGNPVQLYARNNVASNTDPIRADYQSPFTVGNSDVDNEGFQGRIDEARVSDNLVLGPGLPVLDGSAGPPEP